MEPVFSGPTVSPAYIGVGYIIGPKIAGDIKVANTKDTQTLDVYGLRTGEYLLCTAHRAGNVDDPARLTKLVELLAELRREFAGTPSTIRP